MKLNLGVRNFDLNMVENLNFVEDKINEVNVVKEVNVIKILDVTNYENERVRAIGIIEVKQNISNLFKL